MRSPGLGQGYHSRRAPALCLTELGYGVGFMGCIENGNIAIRGNFALARRCENVRPKNWDRDYKAIVPYLLNGATRIAASYVPARKSSRPISLGAGFRTFTPRQSTLPCPKRIKQKPRRGGPLCGEAFPCSAPWSCWALPQQRNAFGCAASATSASATLLKNHQGH
jgi:hypothetical protein